MMAPSLTGIVGDMRKAGHIRSMYHPLIEATSASKNSIQRCLGSALPQLDDDEDFHSTATSASQPLSSGKGTPFILADIGEGIAEVELMQWYVQAGDHVQQFDRVCEVQSDKATVEITSRYDGQVLSLEHAAGEMVKVGEPLMYIATDHDDAPDPAEDVDSTSSTAANEQLHIPTIASQYHFDSDGPSPSKAGRAMNNATSTTNSGDSKVLTSPAIRKLAREHDLDLATIVGTGPKGRVSKGDVLTVLKERGMVLSAPTSPRPKTEVTPTKSEKIADLDIAQSATNPATISSSQDQAALPLQQDTVIPLRGYNRLMASTMTASLEIPHMMYSDEINLNKFFQQKAAQKKASDPRTRLGFLPLTIKAASKALERYPMLNASFDPINSQVTLWKDHNIGIAMDTPRGLLVPVLKQCQDKSIPELTEEIQRLKEAAAQGTVDAEDLKGATFTLSNIGAIGAGGKYMCPVVTPPQVAIGAIGKVERLPRFVGDTMEVEEAHICVISWGGDHRVVDGATMARFHAKWKEFMEDPVRLMMEMK